MILIFIFVLMGCESQKESLSTKNLVIETIILIILCRIQYLVNIFIHNTSFVNYNPKNVFVITYVDNYMIKLIYFMTNNIVVTSKHILLNVPIIHSIYLLLHDPGPLTILRLVSL